MIVVEQNGDLKLLELLMVEQPPVIYFKSSDLLLLGHHGMFRRLDCRYYSKR